MTTREGHVFLFSDVEGSTRLWESYPGEMPLVLAEHDHMLRSAIEETEGQVFKHTGDGILAVFPVPASAVGAALAAQRSLASLEVRDGVPLRVRMAIHRGEAEPRDDDFFGPALNRCARLLDTGWGGQLLISGAAEEGLSDVDLLDLGDHVLKDLSTPVHVYQVLAGDLPHDFPPLRSLSTFTNNLPIQLTSFFGREREIAELLARLGSNRLVTLFGPGGVGKSRLALQIASESLDRYRDGVWLVDLTTVSTGSEVAGAVAQVLRLPDVSGRDAATAVIEATRHRTTLLVLDNCEHVVDAAAVLVDGIVARGADTDVVTTSRESLGVPGEVVHAVRPLSMQEPEGADMVWLWEHPAVALFTDRARAVRPNWRLTAETLPFVAQICRRLDGIPLAIEIAAGRLRSLAPEEIADRLDDRFRLLTGGHRTSLARHQTLKGAIDWSYDLLEPAEKVLFRRLWIFSGRFDMEAVEHVCSDDELDKAEVVDVMTRLVERSLVSRLETKQGRAGFRLLETIRQYALDLLNEAGESEELRDRHAAYYAGLALALAPSLSGADQIAAAERIELDLDNLRAAVEWSLERGDSKRTLEIATATWWMWEARGWFQEPLSWLRGALDQAGEAPTVLRATALHQMAMLAVQVDDYDFARLAIEDGLRVLDDVNNPVAEGWLLHDRAFVAMATGGEGADDDLRRARELAAFGDDEYLEADVAYMTGRVFLYRGELERGIAELTEAHRLARSAGNPWLTVWIQLFLAAAHRDRDPIAAEKYLDDAAEDIETMRDMSAQGFLAESRAYLALRRGDTTSAAEELGKALRFAIDTGSPADQLEMLVSVALLLSMRGDPRAAPLVAALEEEAEAMGFAMEGRTREIAQEVLAGGGGAAEQAELGATTLNEILDLAWQALAEVATEPPSAG